MAFLLISGLGPFRAQSDYLAGTLLGRDFAENTDLQRTYARLIGTPLDPRHLHYGANGSAQPVLRPRDRQDPCLSTVTLFSILDANHVDYDAINIEALWYDNAEPPRAHYDVIGVSTTYLCGGSWLRPVLTWISQRFPEATLVLGGQYSNLKYASILRDHPDVDYIIRGDAELALPMLLQALDDQGDVNAVPNLVGRNPDGTLCMSSGQYVDIETHPSPRFRGEHRIVPYESMRGCPFTCKYCSFPAASPLWRFKSAEKIVDDWKSYRDHNGAGLIAALDSTFTIPPARLRRLFELLPDAGVPWFSYSRANTINSTEMVQQLEASHCRALAIGFESMNDEVLKAMDKRVRASDNRRAFDLLADSTVMVNGSFIVGYPSETPEAYQDTHDFITRELRGRFMLTVFGIVDETMPVWADAEKYQLEVTEDGWRHCGMDRATAARLLSHTMTEARWKNDAAVLISWQTNYAAPLVPGIGAKANRKIEKAIERLAFLPRDLGTGKDAATRARALVGELERMGVRHVS
jgi:radical SAM superfamily enzyme YgiQ (UPF0313 family)